MSRIGKKPILIPKDVEVNIDGRSIIVKGPKGEMGIILPAEISVDKKENVIQLSVKKETKKDKALWGLYRALLQNNVVGVISGFEKTLEIIGVGYKAALEDNKNLKLEVGFSHSVVLEIPDNIKVSVEKSKIIVSGIDKQKVGEFAAKIRAVKKPEPYKGKGIRYLGEKVRRKAGKKAAVASE